MDLLHDVIGLVIAYSLFDWLELLWFLFDNTRGGGGGGGGGGVGLAFTESSDIPVEK